MLDVARKIKLIEINKRRLNKLEEKAAKVGIQMDASIDMEMEDIKEIIEGFETELLKRLQIRKEQKALQGINTDPAILIEIEDLEKWEKENAI